MNFPSLLTLVKSDNIYKISDRIKGFNISMLAQEIIILKQYSITKVQKSKKPLQYILTTIQQNQLLFFQLRQVSSTRSVYTLVEEDFFEFGLGLAMFGERKLIKTKQFRVTGFCWDSFRIKYVKVGVDNVLMQIINQITLPIIKEFNHKELQNKMRNSFQEIISRMVDQKKNLALVDNVVDQLLVALQNHNQIIKDHPHGKQINFNLLKYGKIVQMSLQQEKSIKKVQIPQKMDIEP